MTQNPGLTPATSAHLASVEALWRVDADCIDGHQPLWTQHIEEALSDGPGIRVRGTLADFKTRTETLLTCVDTLSSKDLGTYSA